MAENDDKESKTEAATEKRISEAIEKGNVPFSKEAATFASLLGILIVFSFLLVGNVINLKMSLARFIDDPGGWSLENGADATKIFELIGMDAARLLIPVVIVLAVAGIASSVLQNPPRLVLDRIKPDLSRISVMKGWGRIFGKQGQVEFLRALFKLIAVTAVGFILLRAAQFDMVNAMFVEPSGIPTLVRGMAVHLVSAIAVATAALVAADLVWARIFWSSELRMTRHEVKEEHKQTDGNPIVKSRLRSLARDRLRKRMIAAVPQATLVIANPTHYAIALRYVREEGGAPIVVAKGQDLIALKIRQVAEEHSIPVIEDKLLARSLYKSVEVDRVIPPEFYKAVAEIIFFLHARGAYGKRGA